MLHTPVLIDVALIPPKQAAHKQGDRPSLILAQTAVIKKRGDLVNWHNCGSVWTSDVFNNASQKLWCNDRSGDTVPCSTPSGLLYNAQAQQL